MIERQACLKQVKGSQPENLFEWDAHARFLVLKRHHVYFLLHQSIISLISFFIFFFQILSYGNGLKIIEFMLHSFRKRKKSHM